MQNAVCQTSSFWQTFWPILLATLAGAFVAAFASWLLARNAQKRQDRRDMDAANAQYEHDLDAAVAEVIGSLGRYIAMGEVSTFPLATRGAVRGAISTIEQATQELGTALLVAQMTARGQDQQPIRLIYDTYLNRFGEGLAWDIKRLTLEAFSTNLSAWRSGKFDTVAATEYIRNNAADVCPGLTDASEPDAAKRIK